MDAIREASARRSARKGTKAEAEADKWQAVELLWGALPTRVASAPKMSPAQRLRAIVRHLEVLGGESSSDGKLIPKTDATGTCEAAFYVVLVWIIVAVLTVPCWHCHGSDAFSGINGVIVASCFGFIEVHHSSCGCAPCGRCLV